MQVQKVKYAIWAADHLRAIKFYQKTFGAELSFEMEVWSEVTLCGSTIGIHGGGDILAQRVMRHGEGDGLGDGFNDSNG